MQNFDGKHEDINVVCIIKTYRLHAVKRFQEKL